MSEPAVAPSATEIPREPVDWLPLALPAIVAVVALPLVGDPWTWLTLTIAGLAMGMIIFTVSSGLMLVFGLMDVLNFGHGAFIALGAYVGLSVLVPLTPWVEATSVLLNLAVFALALCAGVAVTGLVGFVFDRLLIQPVYGNHLKQILMTTGGLIIIEQLIRAIWGAETVSFNLPATLRGSWLLGESAVERYRVVALGIGCAVFAGLWLILTKTRIGLMVRAGVENREMLEAMGYRTRHLFVGVFVVGAMLAGLGGVMWGLYLQNFTAAIGAQINVLIFIVIIIGGLGSTTGCLIGALLVGLTTNYVGFAAPKIALFSNILIMLLVLLWRPQGLYKVVDR
jgi:branched-chain amino acid transport system permease protein